MPRLDPVGQHGAVDFSQNVVSNFHDKIGADAQNVSIKGSMVNLAQRYAVYDGSNA